MIKMPHIPPLVSLTHVVYSQHHTQAFKRPLSCFWPMSPLSKWIYGLTAWFMNVHSPLNRRAGDFYTSSHVGQWAELIKEAPISPAWLIQAWRRITVRIHSHTTVIAGQQHLLPSKRPSTKPGMLEDFTLSNPPFTPEKSSGCSAVTEHSKVSAVKL